MCDSCCNTSKTDNISRVLVISFIKLVTVTGNLLGTALGLAAAHGDTAEHSLSVLSSVAKYAIIPLLLINAYVFKIIPEYRKGESEFEGSVHYAYWSMRAFYLLTLLFCLACALFVGVYNLSHARRVFDVQGLEFLLLPAASTASCILKVFLDPYNYLAVREVDEDDIDKHYSDMVRCVAQWVRVFRHEWFN